MVKNTFKTAFIKIFSQVFENLTLNINQIFIEMKLKSIMLNKKPISSN